MVHFVPFERSKYNIIFLFNFDEVIFDLSKAFDLVLHKRVIHKLKDYGTTVLADLFEDFVKNREQRVILGRVSSE